uniref:CSN12-like protein n=1 Tax=Parastrongyloides trichosuri TaxID=131310 RepID=A0A0N5A2W6_PARTI
MSNINLIDWLADKLVTKRWEDAENLVNFFTITKWKDFKDYNLTLSRLNELPDEFAKLIRKLLVAFNLYLEGKYDKAFTEHSEAIKVLTGEVSNNNKTNWFLPIVYALADNQKHLASKIGLNDYDSRRHEAYLNCSGVIRSILTMCSGDSKTRKDISKRVGLVNILNHCMRLGFLTSNFTGLSPVINLIENDEELQGFASKKDLVMYNYYLGKHSLFEDELERAEKCLTFALYNNHPDYVENRKKILVYLITVKLLLDKAPPTKLLEESGLQAFIPVIQAVVDGNLSDLDKALEKHESFFIQYGILLLLEKLKQTTFLILFKKMYYDVFNCQHLIPIKAYYLALVAQNYTEYDEMSVEALLAVMISEKKIRGYLSHSHRKIVLSKQNPFGS